MIRVVLAIMALVAVFALNFWMDVEERRRRDRAADEYTGIKDDPETDDSLPW